MKQKNYETPIANKSLQKLLNSMHPFFMKQSKIDIFKLWGLFIDEYADDQLFFNIEQMPNNNIHEYFHLKYSIFDIDFIIVFDIDRIINSIKESPDNYSTYASSQLKNNYYYQEMPEFNTKHSKDTNPLIVFLPVNKGSSQRKFAVIDGNTRVSAMNRNNHEFYFYYVDASNLDLAHFRDLNSWTAFHLLSCYFLIFYNSHNSQQITLISDFYENLINEAMNDLT